MTSHVMFVTEHVPGHDAGFQKSGHGHYLQTFIDHFLQRGFDLTLVVLRPKVDFLSLAPNALPFRVEGPAFSHAFGRLTLRLPDAILRSALWFAFSRLPSFAKHLASKGRTLLRRLKGYSHDLGRPLSPPERAYVAEAARRINPDIVIYDSIFNVCEKHGTAQHWVITHEVKYQRVRSFSERGVTVSPRGFDADIERAIIERVGNVIAIQWDDADEFRRLAPSARVVVVPVAMNVPANPGEVRRPIAGRLVFVGSGSFHNYDGIRWFVERCWPLVREASPTATLHIVGTVCFRLGDVPAGITLRGVVDDVTEAYSQAAVAIVPLKIGSGLKVKIVEALAHGLPVVTTSVGAQGLSRFVPPPFEISDDARDFAQRCVAILHSGERQDELARSARICAEHFTFEKSFSDFDEASRSETFA